MTSLSGTGTLAQRDNLIGADLHVSVGGEPRRYVDLDAAAEELHAGGERNQIQEDALVRASDDGLAGVPGLRRLGPVSDDRLPVAAFVIDGMPHGRSLPGWPRSTASEYAAGASAPTPYLSRQLALTPSEVERFYEDARANRHDRLPGAVRVSCSSATPLAVVAALGDALRDITDPS